MKGISIVLAAVAYTVGTWGYILVKGYNVTLTQWVTPFHPYDGAWPPKCVPSGFIFPTSKQPGIDCAQQGRATISSSPQEQKLSGDTAREHRPIPGSVQGRF